MVTRVVLLGKPLAVRQALRQRLSLEPDLSVVGEADDSAQALVEVGTLTPDCVLVDAETPDLDVVAVAQALLEHSPELRIVVISLHSAALREALADTPATVIDKTDGLKALVDALRSARRS